MYIEKQDRWLLFWRGFIGTVGFTCLALGVALIPLLIQNTIFNTAPFWASILGWVFLKEKLTMMEVVAMVISFGGVLCISLSGHFQRKDDKAPVDLQEEFSASHLLGCGLVFVTSWCYAGVTALSRKLQKIHFSVMLFYYSLIALPVTLAILLGESWINDHPVRFFTAYSLEQYGWMFLVALVNWLGLCCGTIAA